MAAPANIKVELQHHCSKYPARQYATDAGFDLFIADVSEIKDGMYKIDFGLCFEPPKGYYLELMPRSSIYKNECFMMNSVGIIDPDYRGPVSMVVKCFNNSFLPKVGDRFAQIILRKLHPSYMTVSKLSKTNRGTGGFGSTGGLSVMKKVRQQKAAARELFIEEDDEFLETYE